MPGEFVLSSAPGHHKRPHEDVPSKIPSDNQLHWLDHLAPAGRGCKGSNSARADSSSVASSHKRARLFGEYRENSFIMEESESDEDGETTLCSNVAVRSTSDDASTGRWLLRSSPSNFSITSTLTEISDTMETVSNTGGEAELTDDPGPPCVVVQGKTLEDVGEQVENITSRLDNWSLTKMKTMRISNLLTSVAKLPDMNDEAMSESRSCRKKETKKAKREVMRAFRRSNSTITD